jgi:hypothetical protein
MLKKIIFSIGLSLIIGIASGYILEEQKYFAMRPNSVKTEITENYYRNKSGSDWVAKEMVFNTEIALVIGLSSLGLFLIISSVVGRKANSKETN